MTSIQVFDPALCCSTGVCGVEEQLSGACTTEEPVGVERLLELSVGSH
jgi:Arsenical resistance operon protein ArsD